MKVALIIIAIIVAIPLVGWVLDFLLNYGEMPDGPEQTGDE